MGWIPTDASIPLYPLMPVCDETTRFVDNHIITVDLDPETERNVRAHERNAVLDDVQAVLADPVVSGVSYVNREEFLQRLARLRPGAPLDG